MKELRESILADEELVASKRRFGLFSQPPPIAIGDDSAFPSKIGAPSSIQPKKERTANQSPSPATCWQDPIEVESTGKLLSRSRKAFTRKIHTPTPSKRSWNTREKCTASRRCTRPTSNQPAEARPCKFVSTQGQLSLRLRRGKAESAEKGEEGRQRAGQNGARKRADQPHYQSGNEAVQTCGIYD